MSFSIYSINRVGLTLQGQFSGQNGCLVSVIALATNFILFLKLMNEETQLQPVVVEELAPKIADETKTLVTLKNFEYLINQPKCAVDESSNTPFFVILVNSHPDNAELRQAIRDTWAHYDKRIKTYFLLGSTKSVEHQQRIKAENDEFVDIIQGNFIDSFRMLSHKDVMGLKWFTENCEVAKYLVKVDDDVFANVPALYDYLKSNKNDKIFVLGDYREPEVCPRTGEFAVTEVEYASDYFPSYALSHSIVYSSDIVAQLYEKSCTSEFFFHWADVYVNGLLRAQINVDITSIKEFILTEESMNGMRATSMDLPVPSNFLFSMRKMTPEDHGLLWERTEWYRMGLKND